MRVLSKPEIDHAIMLSELNLVLENFGIQRVEEEDDAEALKEEVENRKQKMTKKKQIKAFIHSNASQEGQAVYEVMLAVLERFDFQPEQLMGALAQHKYEQLIKSKKKEAKVELIKRDDFLEVVRAKTGIELMQLGEGMLVELLSQVLFLDAKYADVYQMKSIQQLLEECVLRLQREEQERKALEDFYKPGRPTRPREPNTQLERVGELDEEPSNDNNISNDQGANKEENVEVLNFEELMSREDEERTGSLQLNEIAEDAANEDRLSPSHPSHA